MGSCAAPSAKGDDKFITTDYLQQCQKEIIWEGKTDLRGKSNLSLQNESKRYEALIGFDDWSSIFDDEDDYEEEHEEEFEIGEHGMQAEENNLEE